METNKQEFLIIKDKNNNNENPLNEEYHVKINYPKEMDALDLETNCISTSKYTFLNCIPKILMEQFSKMANIYFLMIAIMQVIKFFIYRFRICPFFYVKKYKKNFSNSCFIIHK
jgi:hypothetical protein